MRKLNATSTASVKASKATFAQLLIKKLDKMDIIEVEEEDASAMNLRFPHAQASGKVVVEAKNVSKAFGEKKVITNRKFSDRPWRKDCLCR